jgi:hypothetical protein
MRKLIALMSVLLLLTACQKEAEEVVIEEPVVEEFVVNMDRNRFDGTPLEAGETQEYKAVAVMVNNSTIARPHSGLSQADVVYEVIKEEYYETRFMAIFEGEFPEVVGPLRSIRVPFVLLFNEWQSALVHYGGSGSVGQDGTANPDSVNALDMLPKIYVPYRMDAVAGINDEYFFRSNDKPAPHNAYIYLEEASQDFPVVWARDHFLFDEIEYDQSEDNATTMTIDYPTESANKVSYVYNSEIKQYDRFVNDKAHMDVLYDQQISATNVIVEYAEHTEVKGYVLVEFKYRGKADYFIDGKHISGYWIKDFEEDITHWYTDEDELLIIQPGNTWIQIVPSDQEIEWK